MSLDKSWILRRDFLKDLFKYSLSGTKDSSDSKTRHFSTLWSKRAGTNRQSYSRGNLDNQSNSPHASQTSHQGKSGKCLQLVLYCLCGMMCTFHPRIHSILDHILKILRGITSANFVEVKTRGAYLQIDLKDQTHEEYI